MHIKLRICLAAAALALWILFPGLPAAFAAGQQQSDTSPKAQKKKPASAATAAKDPGSAGGAESKPLSKGDELSEEQAGARDFQLPPDDAAKPTPTSDQKKTAAANAAAKPGEPAPAKPKDPTKAGTPPHSN